MLLLGPGPTITDCTFEAVNDASLPPPHAPIISRIAREATVASRRTGRTVFNLILFLPARRLEARSAGGRLCRKTSACAHSTGRRSPAYGLPRADGRFGRPQQTYNDRNNSPELA